MLVRGNDLVTVTGMENSQYLAMFGGPGSWWGNYLTPNNPYNSQTEKVIQSTPLNSAGRVTIDKAMKADLAYLAKIPGTTYTLRTAITAPDRLEVEGDINGQQFDFVWNPDISFLTYQVK